MLKSLLRRAVVLSLGASVGFSAVMVTALPLTVHAKTFRWTDQGDANTMDPHAQNELLTNAINGQVYETLLNRDKQMKLKAVLATEWQQTGPKQWQLKLRRDVKFHDGSAFTAEDVVFSVKRAQENTSAIKSYALGLGEPRKADDFTVEFNLKDVNPIFLETQCEKTSPVQLGFSQNIQIYDGKNCKIRHERVAWQQKNS